jgi:alpha-L-fucosidase
MAKVKIHTDELYEDTSTHDVYRRLLDGTYELVKVFGAGLVRLSASEVAEPSQWYLPFTGSAGTNDNDVVYTSTDVSLYNYHTIECTAGTVDIQVSVDGTNYNTTQAAVLLHDDVTTGGGVFVLTIASGKIGILKGKFKNIKILQNGATASNARGGHGVV